MPSMLTVLSEKPSASITASVPISETGMAMAGMTVLRQLCRNKNTTAMTNANASPSDDPDNDFLNGGSGENFDQADPLDFVHTIAVARITMPASVVRLSAGREDMSEEMQALCFLAGANSIFYGPKLLTTPNPERDRDMALLDKLGLRPME